MNGEWLWHAWCHKHTTPTSTTNTISYHTTICTRINTYELVLLANNTHSLYTYYTRNLPKSMQDNWSEAIIQKLRQKFCVLQIEYRHLLLLICVYYILYYYTCRRVWQGTQLNWYAIKNNCTVCWCWCVMNTRLKLLCLFHVCNLHAAFALRYIVCACGLSWQYRRTTLPRPTPCVCVSTHRKFAYMRHALPRSGQPPNKEKWNKNCTAIEYIPKRLWFVQMLLLLRLLLVNDGHCSQM